MLQLHALAAAVEADPRPRLIVRMAADCHRLHPELGNRPDRALFLAIGGAVLPHPTRPALRLVRSQRHPTECYVVNPDTGACSCPDWRQQQSRGFPTVACKHLLAVLMVEHAQKESRQSDSPAPAA